MAEALGAVSTAEDRLKTGGIFIKFPGHGSGRSTVRRCWVGVHKGDKAICWGEANKLKPSGYIPITQLFEIKKGHQTPAFERAKSKGPPAFCFSIVGTNRSLDLQTLSKFDRDVWFYTFQTLLDGECPRVVFGRSPEEKKEVAAEVQAVQKQLAALQAKQNPNVHEAVDELHRQLAELQAENKRLIAAESAASALAAAAGSEDHELKLAEEVERLKQELEDQKTSAAQRRVMFADEKDHELQEARAAVQRLTVELEELRKGMELHAEPEEEEEEVEKEEEKETEEEEPVEDLTQGPLQRLRAKLMAIDTIKPFVDLLQSLPRLELPDVVYEDKRYEEFPPKLKKTTLTPPEEKELSAVFGKRWLLNSAPLEGQNAEPQRALNCVLGKVITAARPTIPNEDASAAIQWLCGLGSRIGLSGAAYAAVSWLILHPDWLLVAPGEVVEAPPEEPQFADGPESPRPNDVKDAPNAHRETEISVSARGIRFTMYFHFDLLVSDLMHQKDAREKALIGRCHVSLTRVMTTGSIRDGSFKITSSAVLDFVDLKVPSLRSIYRGQTTNPALLKLADEEETEYQKQMNLSKQEMKMRIKRMSELKKLQKLPQEASDEDGFFIINAKWFRCWRSFIKHGTNRPGKINNGVLLKRKKIRRGLVLAKDYRAIKPSHWHFLLNEYGGGPPIQRNTTDIYKD